MITLCIIAAAFALSVLAVFFDERRRKKARLGSADIFAQLDRVDDYTKRQWAREKRRAIRGQR